jgi:hypothetical protein
MTAAAKYRLDPQAVKEHIICPYSSGIEYSVWSVILSV